MARTVAGPANAPARDTTSPAGRLRIGYLDGLRGAAALLVLLQHIAEGVLKTHTLPLQVERLGYLLLGEAFNFGRFGVALFFIISGFVIPFSFRTDQPLRAFAIGRLFRLYPAYWLSLLFALAVLAGMEQSLPSGATILTNATMFQKFVGRPDIVNAYWTLSAELAFYILCAGLVLFELLRRPGALTLVIVGLLGVAVVVAIASAQRGRPLPSGLPLHLSLMLIGTLLRRVMLEADAVARRWLPWLVLVFVVVAPFVQFVSVPEIGQADRFLRPLGSTLAYYAALAAFVIAARRGKDFGSVASWFGAISYSVYLFHGTLLALFKSVLVTGRAETALYYLLLVAIGSVAIATLVYYAVERPMVTLGHRLTRRGAGAVR